MIIPIELRFKADKGSKSAFRTEKTIKSHDVNSVEFHITIDGLELTDNHTAKILSIFHSSKSQANVDCEIIDGKIIYKPDTSLISMHEHVTSYVYVYNGNQSLDVCEFLYIVGLSKIDETSLEVKEVYDQSYAALLADFEQALNDYKDNLPQADSVRAEIDEILNQFSEDSQAKLSQYDTDVQQVITDINEAETSRVEAEGQRESAETSRKANEADRDQAESERQTNETKRQTIFETNESERDGTFSTNETVRQENETTRQQAEAQRVSAESIRVSAEAQRKIDHANRSAELAGKADKKQEDWITVPVYNGVQHGKSPLKVMKDNMGVVHFKGSLTNLIAESKSFSLPVGYRPDIGSTESIIRIPVSSNGGREITTMQINYVGDAYIANRLAEQITYFDGVSFVAKRG